MAPNPPAAPSLSDADPLDFEAALKELETLVTSMEGGQLSLEQSLTAYKRGAQLVQSCRTTLAQAQQQVKILEENLLKPFDALDGESQPS
jgi:exodeoxyribonuclease VII small subunit